MVCATRPPTTLTRRVKKKEKRRDGRSHPIEGDML
jgi:hypothetical protein